MGQLSADLLARRTDSRRLRCVAYVDRGVIGLRQLLSLRDAALTLTDQAVSVARLRSLRIAVFVLAIIEQNRCNAIAAQVRLPCR